LTRSTVKIEAATLRILGSPVLEGLTVKIDGVCSENRGGLELGAKWAVQ
jgi:hypothetical protein